MGRMQDKVVLITAAADGMVWRPLIVWRQKEPRWWCPILMQMGFRNS